MNADPRTIMMVMAAMNILFSGMLGLVAMHAGSVKGARQWALANLLMGSSFAVGSQIVGPQPMWMAGFFPMILGAGLGLLYNGVEAFKGKKCQYWLPIALAVLLMVNNLALMYWMFNPKIRIFINVITFGLLYAACARELFLKIAQPLRTAYWIAASAFTAMALAAFARAIGVLVMPVESVTMFTNFSVHPYALFFAAIAQMAMAFGLMLMITYQLAHELRALASLDPLTGLLNRRTLEKEGERQTAHCKRYGQNLAMMMIDVDHFKDVNDRFGHLAGDEVLRRLAKLMQSVVRCEDYVARYGGEEFCILLPSTNEEQAAVLAERLQRVYAELCIEWKGQELHSTISIGVADARLSDIELPTLIAAADLALYRAKKDGRNRVVCFSACATRDDTL
jgi:diguanylate cyclase (GGDEF)-like protein